MIIVFWFSSPFFLTLSLFSMSGTPSRAQPWRILRIAISPKGVDQTLVELLPTNLDYFGVSINAGYPQVIIHFIFVFSLITHTFWGTPIYGTPHFMVQWLKFSCFNTGNLVPEVACHGVLWSRAWAEPKPQRMDARWDLGPATGVHWGRFYPQLHPGCTEAQMPLTGRECSQLPHVWAGKMKSLTCWQRAKLSERAIEREREGYRFVGYAPVLYTPGVPLHAEFAFCLVMLVF